MNLLKEALKNVKEFLRECFRKKSLKFLKENQKAFLQRSLEDFIRESLEEIPKVSMEDFERFLKKTKASPEQIQGSISRAIHARFPRRFFF